MLNTFSFCEYGDIEIKNVVFDLDGTNLEEGIEISFTDKDVEIPTIKIIGYIDLDEITADEVESLIENNI